MQAFVPDTVPAESGARVLALWQGAGWTLWPLALCALVAAGLVLWKLSDLSVRIARTLRLLERVDSLIEQGMIAEALSAARESPTVGGRVLAAGLARRAGGADRVLRSIANAGAIEAASLGRGLILLAAIAATAPLIGFFGALMSLLAASAAENGGSALRAALVPAMTGLAIAIPSAIMHHYLSRRVDRVMRRIGESGERAVRAIEATDASAGPAA